MMTHLGYLSDAIFHSLDGEITDRGDYFLIRTPTNPTYFWGNFLLFKSPPSSESHEKWLQIHQEEFGPKPRHIALGWDSDEKGDPSQFLKDGFELTDDIVLTLSGSSTQVRTNPELEIRRLAQDWEWQASIELQIAEGFPRVNDEDYRIFKTAQMANYRLNSERGHGDWWGAFLGDELVGDMGLYFDLSKKIARFQNVGTSIPHRRKRVCTTLLDTVVRQSLSKAEQLVIVTEPSSVAETIYRSLGFQEHCFQFGLLKRPES